MRSYTFAQAKNEVETSYDLLEETFISPDEMVSIFNRAVHEAESIILGMYEDYFLSSGNLTMVVGGTLLTLPTDIYAQKIRKIVYQGGTGGSLIYNIKQIRGQDIFEQISMINTFGLWDDYRYILVNPTGNTQAQIQIAPPSREASTTNVTIWYIRSAQRILQASELSPPQSPTAPNSAAQLNTVLDIPEFSSFIIEYAKYLCLLKDTDPRLPEQKEIMLNQKSLMMASLKERIADNDTTIVPDMHMYVISS